MISAEYLAGFFDGEGTIVTYAHERRHKNGEYKQFVAQLRISLTNTNLNVLHKIQESWGGKIFCRAIGEYSKPNWKRAYMLTWDSKTNIFKVLESISPYLIIKKAQVDLVIEKWPRIRLANKWHRTSEADRINCGAINTAIRNMNKRGVEVIQ